MTRNIAALEATVLSTECLSSWSAHDLINRTSALYCAHREILHDAKDYALGDAPDPDVTGEIGVVIEQVAQGAFELTISLPEYIRLRPTVKDWNYHRRLLRELFFRHVDILVALKKTSPVTQQALATGRNKIRAALEKLGTLTSVFVCYSGKDKEAVQAVLKQIETPLKNRLIKVWFDERDLKDSDWRSQLLRNLELIDCAVVMSSAHLHTTEFVKEYELPRILQKFPAEMEALQVVLTRCMPECAHDLPECETYTEYLRQYLRYPRDQTFSEPLIGDLVKDIMRLAARCSDAGDDMRSQLDWYEDYYHESAA